MAGLKLQSWLGNWENYEVPNREMTRKLRKKQREPGTFYWIYSKSFTARLWKIDPEKT